MDDEIQYLEESPSEDAMETDETHVVNDNSNEQCDLVFETESNSADVGADESSISNQGLSTGSAGDFLDTNSGFNAVNIDIGDNAVTFANVPLSSVLTDSEAHNAMEQRYMCQSDQLTEEIDSINNDCTATFSKTLELTHDTVTSEPEKDVTENTDSLEINIQAKSKQISKDLEIAEKNKNVDCTATTETKDIQENVDSTDNTKNLNCTEVNEKMDCTEIIEKVESSDKNEPKVPSVKTRAMIKAESKYFTPKGGGAEETEVVSEDELPIVEKPKVKDAENVSDDELPGPKPAELPADTEVVSEDELPASKKDSTVSRKRKNDEDPGDYNPGSPTSDPESSSKKQAVVKNGDSKPVPAEKVPSVEEKASKKVLPELDKYWKVVNDDPTDFTGWTYLLQYVDQESDVDAAREAYDAFLSHYPYCYGYWRKYADYEKRKGSKKKCIEVLEKGLKAIPLSVDLWIHYLNHVKANRSEELLFIKSQYERAIEACGLEFRSDRLWESYIKWEAENGSALNVTNIYDRLLTTPTLGYTSHFDNFQEHVMSEPVSGVVSHSELVRLRAEAREGVEMQIPLDLPPGEDEPDDHIASEEEAQAIKERIIAARRKIHKTTGEQVAARWAFEEGIKRPYFHVKPLERCQLKNWKAYLEWEKQHGSFKRSYVLHERCLIACALYEEFWLRLVKFLEEHTLNNPDLIEVERDVLERACTVHHLDKPDLHLHWAHFEETQGNSTRAAEILERIEKACPNLVQIQYRRVNLERRRGDYDKCSQLYEQYITSAKTKPISSALAIKYARFLFHVRHDTATARKVLDDAVVRDPLNQRLHLQRLDLAIHTPDIPYSELEEIVKSYEKQYGADLEVCAAFAWRRRELAEELGDAEHAREAATHQRLLARQLRKRARKDKHEQPPPTSDGSKKKDMAAPSSNNANNVNSGNQPGNNTYYQNNSAPPQTYDQSYTQSYNNSWGYPQPPGPYQHHPHPWPQYTNYY